ncbi:MAG: replication initiation protein [Verrucomicrobiota bacterium]
MASIDESEKADDKPLSTISIRGSGHPLDPSSVGQIIKPGELVDFIEITALNRSELIMYNQLLAHAWPDIGDRTKVHRISKAVLRGSHESNDRLNKAFDTLMSAWARIQYKHHKTGEEKTLRVHLIGSNAEEKQEQGYFYWTFPRELVAIIENSKIWAKIKSQIMYSLSSKYSLRLYEMVARRIGMHKQFEEFSVDKLRTLMGVPKGKLKRFADLNKHCLKPALAEVNQLSDFHVGISMVKRGRTVEKLMINWSHKDAEEIRQAANERERSSVGRSARRAGRVEAITF